MILLLTKLYTFITFLTLRDCCKYKAIVSLSGLCVPMDFAAFLYALITLYYLPTVHHSFHKYPLMLKL
ncbi:hypothetical protein V1477_012614 [Vespula maculifrons]|uniref:Uncharacterized protein n=1 Tax=Vespula maculifrons TaxID=7453 RepID=A0ABD2BU37_VESMC